MFLRQGTAPDYTADVVPRVVSNSTHSRYPLSFRPRLDGGVEVCRAYSCPRMPEPLCSARQNSPCGADGIADAPGRLLSQPFAWLTGDRLVRELVLHAALEQTHTAEDSRLPVGAGAGLTVLGGRRAGQGRFGRCAEPQRHDCPAPAQETDTLIPWYGISGIVVTPYRFHTYGNCADPIGMGLWLGITSYGIIMGFVVGLIMGFILEIHLGLGLERGEDPG